MKHQHGKCEACQERRAELRRLVLALDATKLALRDARTANDMLRVRPPKSAIELAALAAWGAWRQLDESARQHIRRATLLSPALGRACKRLAILLGGNESETVDSQHVG